MALFVKFALFTFLPVFVFVFASKNIFCVLFVFVDFFSFSFSRIKNYTQGNG